MKFVELEIPGVWVVEPDVFPDERGAFTRAWVADEFQARGLETAIAQGSLTTNHRRGTVRGMHYQASPFEEVKLVRAVRGAVYDVAVDLRPDSPTYCRWVGVELSAKNQHSLYLPRGIAHGYQTLTDEADIFYFVSAPYTPSHQRGVRWDDPSFGITWPLGPPALIHPRDASYPDYARVR
jgi:dTDP-4-dehydrorhamnose 3,5-epimerase